MTETTGATLPHAAVAGTSDEAERTARPCRPRPSPICGLTRGASDPALDDLARIAAAALRAPVAVVALGHGEDRWLAGHDGLSPSATAPTPTYAAWGEAASTGLLVVTDAAHDPPFADDPAVRGEHRVRFFAGVSIRAADGSDIGTLCVVDHRPRPGLTPTEEEVLRGLGRQSEQRLDILTHHELARRSEQALLRAELIGRTGSVSFDLHTGSWSWSPGMYALAGLSPDDPRPVEELRRATFVEDEDQAEAAYAIAESVRTGVPGQLRRRLRRADGAIRICQGYGEVEHDAVGPVRFRATMVDVTDDAEREEELHRERSLLTGVLTHLTEGVVACDAQGRVTLLNRAAEALHGRRADPTAPVDSLPSAYDLRRVDGRPLPADQVPLLRALRGEEVHDQDLLICPPGRPERVVSCNGQQLTDDEGTVLGAVITMVDVTERRAREASLRDAATRDPLTKLANRTAFDAALAAALQGPGADEVAVIFIDLDGFKALNDGHGHAVGDQVLAAVATELRTLVRPGDVVSRRGGDEFAVLLPRTDLASARRIALRLEGALDGSRRMPGSSVPLRATVGLAHRSEGESLDAAGLLALADARMYAGKPSVSPGHRMAPGR